jgi:hypothetical protein
LDLLLLHTVIAQQARVPLGELLLVRGVVHRQTHAVGPVSLGHAAQLPYGVLESLIQAGQPARGLIVNRMASQSGGDEQLDPQLDRLGNALRHFPQPDRAAFAIGCQELNRAPAKASNTPGGWRNCNLRTQFGRIIKRAGLEPWPRLFHALRASRETELAAEYPVHVVTAWLGNTPKIAMKHYLMTTESDFSKAIGKLVQMAVQNPVQLSDNSGANSGAAASRGVSQEVARNDISRCETTAYAKSCDDLPRPARIISGEDRTGTPPENTGNSLFSAEGAANSGAVADVGVLAAELARIVAVWPMLSAPIRRAMLALVECNG